ncbi:hypothetical protein DY000_02046930 [Brassica cretica]|nr:hypothetical protein DY000_02046930 [Brassica cretica]
MMSNFQDPSFSLLFAPVHEGVRVEEVGSCLEFRPACGFVEEEGAPPSRIYVCNGVSTSIGVPAVGAEARVSPFVWCLFEKVSLCLFSEGFCGGGLALRHFKYSLVVHRVSTQIVFLLSARVATCRRVVYGLVLQSSQSLFLFALLQPRPSVLFLVLFYS